MRGPVDGHLLDYTYDVIVSAPTIRPSHVDFRSFIKNLGLIYFINGSMHTQLKLYIVLKMLKEWMNWQETANTICGTFRHPENTSFNEVAV